MKRSEAAAAPAGKRRAAGRADREPADDAGPLALPLPEDPPHRRRARLTWVRLIRKIYEIDPLLCPFCGAEMKIIAFITEHSTVRRILRHLDVPPQSPEIRSLRQRLTEIRKP